MTEAESRRCGPATCVPQTYSIVTVVREQQVPMCLLARATGTVMAWRIPARRVVELPAPLCVAGGHMRSVFSVAPFQVAPDALEVLTTGMDRTVLLRTLTLPEGKAAKARRLRFHSAYSALMGRAAPDQPVCAPASE
jgi:hypothetical protein